MYALTGVVRDYPWGSTTAIPEFIGMTPPGYPVAEMWFGAHALGESMISDLDMSLGQFIRQNPSLTLGEESLERFGASLPYLVKFIAPQAPLSLQVHPSLEQARHGYARAQQGGPNAPIDYVDNNHKPELLYPLTHFEALAGFRPLPTLVEVISRFDTPTLKAARGELENHGVNGIKSALELVLTEVSPDEVAHVASECGQGRVLKEDASDHAEDVVVRLHEAYPGDPGVVASLFLTPHCLKPGQAMYIPAGVIHVYLGGLGIEVMANSDNVLRAGLTPKNVDVPELLTVVDIDSNVDFPAVSQHAGITRFPLPIEDFQFTHGDGEDASVCTGGQGPGIIVALDQGIEIMVDQTRAMGAHHMRLDKGQAAFVCSGEGPVHISGGQALHVTA